MPLFNFRRVPSSKAAAKSAAQSESVEVMRKRAKHRLIGAAVLVLVGVVGFPLLFDTQPRPVAVDIPIEIPGKNAVKPLQMPTLAPTVAANGAAVGSDKEAAPVGAAPREEILTEKKAEILADPEQPTIKKEAKSEPKEVAKTPPSGDEGTRAKALLEGKAAPAEADERLVVQVGAFADADKAREVRQRLEKAGLKTYTQVAETKDGKRIRVRVGPFSSRTEADKAASTIKGLDLPAVILSL